MALPTAQDSNSPVKSGRSQRVVEKWWFMCINGYGVANESADRTPSNPRFAFCLLPFAFCLLVFRQKPMMVAISP
jgi:hypothetical protein